MREIPQLARQPGIALVLSGGATKAFYFHLGVLKVLHPENITSIIGSSAGAVIGALIASGASPDTLIATLYQKRIYIPRFDTWVKTLTSTMLFKPKYQDILWQALRTQYASLRFLTTLPRRYQRDIVAEAIDMLVHSQESLDGLFSAIALENLFKSVLPSADFADTEIDLYVVATELDSGDRAVFNGKYEFSHHKSHFITDVPIHRAIRASTAIPGLFEPVKIKGKNYVDGEVKQTLSADIGVRLADTVVISHTYQPLKMLEGQSVRNLGWLNILRQTTSIVLRERIDAWREIYQKQNPDKQLIWISPDPDDVDFFLAPDFSFQPDIQKEMIRCGEIAALQALKALDIERQPSD